MTKPDRVMCVLVWSFLKSRHYFLVCPFAVLPTPGLKNVSTTRVQATTGVQDRFISNQALRNRSQTAHQNVANLHQATGVRVTGQTIRNHLHAAHLHARQPRVVPTLTNRYIAHIIGQGASELGYPSLVTWP